MRNEIKAILARLKEIEGQVDNYREKAEDRGQEEKAETLEAELEFVREAIESLESID